ncbi:TPA: PAAR domain-containing protein [Enterobacter asburiae]
MARALACLGDKTSYGEIISATASWYEGSKAIARTGDKASCSKCSGYFEILASAQDWAEEGKAYAATGDRVLLPRSLCVRFSHAVYQHRHWLSDLPQYQSVACPGAAGTGFRRAELYTLSVRR